MMKLGVIERSTTYHYHETNGPPTKRDQLVEYCYRKLKKCSAQFLVKPSLNVLIKATTCSSTHHEISRAAMKFYRIVENCNPKLEKCFVYSAYMLFSVKTSVNAVNEVSITQIKSKLKLTCIEPLPSPELAKPCTPKTT